MYMLCRQFRLMVRLSLSVRLLIRPVLCRAECRQHHITEFATMSSEPTAAVKRASDGLAAVVDETAKKPRLEPQEQQPQDAQSKAKRLNYALLLSYCGAKYLGMQINKEFPTIERMLFIALRQAALITEKEFNLPPSVGLNFQRAARTDKGVSAVKQTCSLRLALDAARPAADYVSLVNQHLPDDIRLMGMKRATKGFNAKTKADSRTYYYTLPSFALAPIEQVVDHTYRMEPAQADAVIAQVNDLLAIYVGTHNFYNFTSRRQHGDASCNRYIMSFSCGQPFLLDDWQMVTMCVHGQSFMLHQIRKMIGLVIAITRGVLQKSVIQKAWESDRLDIPIAPGLGLMLGKVHYEKYDRKFQSTHESLDAWPECEDAVSQFKRDFIDREIVERERKDNSMMQWLAQLHEPDANWGLPTRTHEQRQAYVQMKDAPDDPVEDEEQDDD